MSTKTHAIALALAATVSLVTAAAPAAAADVGVSVSISEPGVYGRIDIGRFPQPQVVVSQPVLVMPAPSVVVRPEPVYMWVPPGHRRKWSKHCGRYNACGVPVYFVQDRWYRQHVIVSQPGPAMSYGEHRGHSKHKHKNKHDD